MVDISIITATFQREDFLAEAIASVQAIDTLNWEMLIGDDSAEGSAAAVVERFSDSRITYQKNPRPTGGIPALIRNRLASQAKGRILYFLDDDDHLVAESLVAMVHELDKSSAAMAIGDVLPFGKNREALEKERQIWTSAKAFLQTGPSRKKLAMRLLFGMPALVCSSCIIKKSAFLDIGGFDVSIKLCEDVDMYLRAARALDFIYIPRILLKRRYGESSLIFCGSTGDFAESYQRICDNYRQRFGRAEFFLLKLAKTFR